MFRSEFSQSQEQSSFSRASSQQGEEKKETPLEQCEFCSIPETKGTQLFREMYNKDQILNIPSLPRDFTTMQDVVPIAEKGGHVLLIPNRVGEGHYISLAIVNNQEQLAIASKVVTAELNKVFPENPIFTFEHGPGFIEGEPIACGGCHLDHAHGHMLLLPKGTTLEPIKTKMEQALDESGWDNPALRAEAASAIFTNIYDIAGINPYLHIGMINSEENDAISFTYVQKSKTENVESQLLRKIIANVVYSEKDATYWHWQDVSMGIASRQKLTQLRNDVAHFRRVTKF